MTIDNEKDLGISRNALSIARMIDRLEEGRWDIVIKKDSIKGICEISISEIQTVSRRSFEPTYSNPVPIIAITEIQI